METNLVYWHGGGIILVAMFGVYKFGSEGVPLTVSRCRRGRGRRKIVSIGVELAQGFPKIIYGSGHFCGVGGCSSTHSEGGVQGWRNSAGGQPEGGTDALVRLELIGGQL